ASYLTHFWVLLPHLLDQSVEGALRHVGDRSIPTPPLHEGLVQVLGGQPPTISLLGLLRQERRQPVLILPHLGSLSLDLAANPQPVSVVRQVPPHRPSRSPLGCSLQAPFYFELGQPRIHWQPLVESNAGNPSPQTVRAFRAGGCGVGDQDQGELRVEL